MKRKVIVAIERESGDVDEYPGIRKTHYVKTKIGRVTMGWIVPPGYTPRRRSKNGESKTVDVYPCVENEPFVRGYKVDKIDPTKLVKKDDAEAAAIANPIRTALAGPGIISNEFLLTLIDGSIAKRLIAPIMLMGFAVVTLVYGLLFGLMIGKPMLFQSIFGLLIFMAIMVGLMGYMMLDGGNLGG